jgi:hypothetical protein
MPLCKSTTSPRACTLMLCLTPRLHKMLPASAHPDLNVNRELTRQGCFYSSFWYGGGALIPGSQCPGLVPSTSVPTPVLSPNGCQKTVPKSTADLVPGSAGAELAGFCSTSSQAAASTICDATRAAAALTRRRVASRPPRARPVQRRSAATSQPPPAPPASVCAGAAVPLRRLPPQHLKDAAPRVALRRVSRIIIPPTPDAAALRRAVAAPAVSASARVRRGRLDAEPLHRLSQRVLKSKAAVCLFAHRSRRVCVRPCPSRSPRR